MQFLKSLVKRIPPVAELIGQRNDLQKKLLAAEAKIRDLRSAADAVRRSERVSPTRDRVEVLQKEIEGLQRTVGVFQEQAHSLQSRLDYVAKARAQGRLAEFDYGYHPRVRDWNASPKGNVFRNMISSRNEIYRQWIAALAKYGTYYRDIARAGSADDMNPIWDNGWFPPLDGICLYGLIAETNPRLYIEVGSGNSTKFVRRAISDRGLRTKIVSIDPYPRAVIDDLCDEVIRTPFENVNLTRLEELESGDMMFVDNSHRSFQNSDVTVFFTEVLPSLAKGVLWGVHDIFLPLDYPEDWLGRMYNEQYLLMAYLLGGAGGDQIELPVSYLAQNPDMLADLINSMNPVPWEDVPLVGGAFWMRKA